MEGSDNGPCHRSSVDLGVRPEVREEEVGMAIPPLLRQPHHLCPLLGIRALASFIECRLDLSLLLTLTLIGEDDVGVGGREVGGNVDGGADVDDPMDRSRSEEEEGALALDYNLRLNPSLSPDRVRGDKNSVSSPVGASDRAGRLRNGGQRLPQISSC